MFHHRSKRKKMNKIYSINVDSKTSTLLQVLDIATKTNNKPTFILIQDPPILNRDFNIQTYLKGCDFITSKGNNDTSRINDSDNIILYDKTRAEPIEDVVYNEAALGSKFLVDEKGLYLLFSIYLKPRTNENEIHETPGIIREKILTIGKSRTILAGDINCSDPMWCPLSKVDNRLSDKGAQKGLNSLSIYYHNKIAKGRRISRFLRETKLNCVNDINKGPTFVSYIKLSSNEGDTNEIDDIIHPESYIDIIAAGNKVLRQLRRFKLINILGSQHRLLIALNKRKVSTKKETKLQTPRFSFRTDSITQEHLLTINITTNNMIGENWWNFNINKKRERAELLTKTIIKHTLEIQEFIKKRIGNNKAKFKRGNSATDLIIKRKMIGRLRLLENKIDKVNREHNADRAKNLSYLKFKADKIKSKILFEFKRNIKTGIKRSNNNGEGSILWDTIKDINNIYQLSNKDNGYNSNNINKIHNMNNQQEIERFADSKFGHNNIINDHEDTIPTEELIILGYEIDNAIHNIRKKAFTGPEGIRFSIFNKLLEFKEYRLIIDTWVRICFNAYVPQDCRLTVGKLIPKKAKDQFRVVHISSPLTALLEQIALAKLEFRLEENLLYNPRQFGFSPLRGRHDLISRLLEQSIKHQLRERFMGRSVIISLDVKGAFDNVDQSLLKKKTLEQLAPDTSRFWLANFIRNRRIRIEFKQLIARERGQLRKVFRKALA